MSAMTTDNAKIDRARQVVLTLSEKANRNPLLAARELWSGVHGDDYEASVLANAERFEEAAARLGMQMIGEPMTRAEVMDLVRVLDPDNAVVPGRGRRRVR